MHCFPIRFASVALALCTAAGISGQQPRPSSPTARNALDRANLDTTCAACSDFYTFANGGWLKRSTIPAAYSSWGSFNEVQDKNELVVRDIIEASVKAVHAGAARPSSNVFNIGAYYEACVDTLAIYALGTMPIDGTMARIAKISSRSRLGRGEAHAGRDERTRAVRSGCRRGFEEL